MVTAIPDGGTPPYQDNWFVFNGLTYDLIDDPDDNDINGFGTNGFNNFLEPGSYQVQIIDYNGCEVFWSFNVFDDPIPTDWASVETIETCGTGACDGVASLEIDFDMADDIVYIPNWITCDGEQISTAENDPLTVENLCTGEYTCQVLNSETNEIHSICFTIEDGSFSIDPEVSNITCNGENDGFIDLNISGGTPPYTVDWSNGELYTNIDEIENLPPGIISVDIFDDNNNCVIQQEFVITEPLELIVPPPIPLEVLGGWDTSCEAACDGNIQVNIVGGTPPYSYFWNGVQVIEDSDEYEETVTNICSGEGQLGIIDANGCQVQHSITLDAPPPIQIDVIDITHVNCYESEEGLIDNGAIDIEVTGGQPPYTYEWEFEGNIISTNEDVDGLIEGDYIIMVNDLNGNEMCVEDEEIEIQYPFNFEINPPIWGLADGPATCIDANDGFISLNPSGGTPFTDDEDDYYTYFINGEGPNVILVGGSVENLEVGSYEVIVYDSLGCQFTHNFEVDFIQELCLEIPTVFTPNGDGTAEYWVIEGLKFYPDASVQVYNRWGQLVFEVKTNYYGNEWDGTYEGNNLPFGVYYFIIDFKENEDPKYGGVTIKR
jgi:gliding motility-associated-like protein